LLRDCPFPESLRLRFVGLGGRERNTPKEQILDPGLVLLAFPFIDIERNIETKDALVVDIDRIGQSL